MVTMMSIDEVQSARPQQLVEVADQLGAHTARLQSQIDQGRQSLTEMGHGWSGDASSAATSSGQRTLSQHQELTDNLAALRSTLSAGGSELTSTRNTLLQNISQLTRQGWQVADDGDLSPTRGGPLDAYARVSAVNEMKVQQLAAQGSLTLKEQLAHYDTADRSLAERVGQAQSRIEAITHTQFPQDPPPTAPGPDPGKGDPPKLHDQVPGMDGNPPYENGAHPDSLPATKTRTFAPVRPLPNDAPWVDRSQTPDQQWQAALAHYQPGDPLPDPQYVQDPQLRALGAMARQQGMAYSYGGGHGTKPGPTTGDGSSHATGLDCSGSIRYAIAEASGADPGALSTYGMLGDANGPRQHYAPVTGDPRPGDVIVCGDGADFHHVVMNIGNGYVIDANSDGTPLAVTPMSTEPPNHRVIRPTGQ